MRNCLAVIWLVFLFSGCNPKRAARDAVEMHHNVAQPDVVCEIKIVNIKIENRTNRELFLWRVDNGAESMVLELGKSPKQPLAVESGLYFVADFRQIEKPDGVVAIPLPAIYSVLVSSASPDRPRLTVEFADPPAVNEDWCWIPCGPSLMGDTLGVGQADERPARIEWVAGFWLGRREITNAEYAKFLAQQENIDKSWIDLESRKCGIQRDGVRLDVTQPDLPVVMVSREGALAYCRWLSQKTGRNCRLPSEDEWEKAARGPQSYVYSYGNVYRQDAANQESGQLRAVGSFAPNGFGLFDMTGNVFEWVADKYRPGETSPDQQGLTHVLRGGSFILDGMYLRNSFRMRQRPTVRTDDIGFRVARDASDWELTK